MTTQPQLLKIPLDPGDVVYTPDWVAKDIVEFFKPSGRILEPCAGDGVFLKYLPKDTEWCEIQKGRDFFAWTEPVDWIVGNPPYRIWHEWLKHSFELSDNILYIVPPGKVFGSFSSFVMWKEYGGIKHLYILGPGNKVGFPFGYAIAAFHFQRGYTGPMYSSIYSE